jgi:hypothetical protein
MLPRHARFLVCVLGLALHLAVITRTLLVTSPAYAGPETRVDSSTTTLELGGDGTATVRHELALAVRGERLASFSLRGVDADAEPLPGATLTRLADGRAVGAPEPVLVQARGGVLEVAAPSTRAARGKRFLLNVAYRTHLPDSKVVRLPDGANAELGWFGPRFDDGVDAVTLIVRTPAGRTPPELVGDDETGPQYGMVSSALRRSRDLDELELVRAHVARDEAIRWTLRLDRSLLGREPPSHPGATIAAAPAVPRAPALTSVRQAPAPRFEHGLAASVILGAAYALLLWLKTRAVAASAAVRRATPRPWITWPPAARAVLAGCAVSGAWAAVVAELPPWSFASGLLLAMALAAHHPPAQKPSLLGLGEWQPRGPEVLERQPSAALPGAWLDAGRARGFVLLAVALGGIGALAAPTFAASPYAGACILLSGTVLLPIFCTGRAAELPLDGLDEARRFLGEVVRRLGHGGPLAATPIARVAASGELDDLRLSLAPVRAVPGLRGLELGLELGERLGGFSARPIVIVRAAEGSECQRSLPRGLTWTRGRSPDERASIVRPKLPTVSLSVALLRELAELWRTRPEARVQMTVGAGEPEPAAKKATPSTVTAAPNASSNTRPPPVHAT